MATPPMQVNAGPRTFKQIYADQLFNLGGAAVTTLTQMNSGISAAAGTYPVKADGVLLSVTIKITPQAATSLAQSGFVQLNCTNWVPVNTIILPFAGFGLATAPQAIGGNTLDATYEGLNLPVKSSVAIRGDVIYFFSPVTPNAIVVGKFGAT